MQVLNAGENTKNLSHGSKIRKKYGTASKQRLLLMARKNLRI